MRKQYERQGLLVEQQALERAEAECFGDAQARAKRSERETERRAERDAVFVVRFAERIQEMYPGSPPAECSLSAHHATGSIPSGFMRNFI